MPAIKTIDRRTFLSTGASLVTSGASFMLLPTVYAATRGRVHDRVEEAGSEAQLVQGGHHSDDEMQKCIELCRDCHAMCTQTVGHCLNSVGAMQHRPHSLNGGLRADVRNQRRIPASGVIVSRPDVPSLCGGCAGSAGSCEQVGGDDQMVKQCAEMCRRCADSCERMASKVAA